MNIYRKLLSSALIIFMIVFSWFSGSSLGYPVKSSASSIIHSCKVNDCIFDVSFLGLQCETIVGEDGQSYHSYEFPECDFFNDPGKPQIPFKKIYVCVPSDAQDITLEILSSTEHIEKQSVPLSPVTQTIFVTEGPYTFEKNIFKKDTTFYETFNDFYPQNIVEIIERANIRDVCYVVLKVSPLQYHPSQQEIKLFTSLRLRVFWTTQSDSHLPCIPASFVPLFKQLQLKNFNRDSFEVLRPSLIRPQVCYPTDLGSIRNNAEYLIITADAFYDSPSVRQFAKHKSSIQPMNVSVVNTSLIYSSYGQTIPIDPLLADTDENFDLQIKTFIKYVYDHWGNHTHQLQYILLIGDGYHQHITTLVPTHETYLEFYHQTVATDYWYCCINDDSGDEIINNDDTIADLFLGRFSAQTQEELQRAIEKSIRYELCPPDYPFQEWGSRILLTNGFIGNDSDFNYALEFRDQYLLPNYYETSYITAEDYEGNYQEAIDDVINQMNYGYALILHNSHGSVYTWLFGSVSNGFQFYPYHISKLTNKGKCPIIFSLSCLTGAFHNAHECLGEAFVNARGGGAVAFIGSTGESYAWQNKLFMCGTLTSLLSDENYILGSCLNAGKLSCDDYHRYMYELLGDPALNLSTVLSQSKKPEIIGCVNDYEIRNQTVIVNCTITNRGMSNATDVLVELFVGDPFNDGQVVDNTTSIIDLDSLSQRSCTLEIPLHEEWHGRPLYLYVDRWELIDELCEENNVSSPVLFYTHLEVDANGPYIVPLGDSIGFIGTVVGGGEEPFHWYWEFGDDSNSTEQNPNHLYTSVGNFTVTLTVTDANNHSAQDSAEVCIFQRPAVVIVDDDFNETTPGWMIDHFIELPTAIDAVAINGTIVIKNGTYSSSLYIEKSLRLLGENTDTVILTGNTVRIIADDVAIASCTLCFNSQINLDNTSRCSITDNIITIVGFGDAGIYQIHDPDNTTIARNRFYNFTYGMTSCYTKDDYILDNEFHTAIGIHYYEATSVTIQGNRFYCSQSGLNLIHSTKLLIEDNLFEKGGIDLFNYADTSECFWNTHTIRNNTINMKPLLYVKNQQDITISDDVGQLILVNCNKITVANLSFDNVSCGIQMGYSSNSSISNITFYDLSHCSLYLVASSDNAITGNRFDHPLQEGERFGCWILSSTRNRISDNMFRNNFFGIQSFYSEMNMIYHNNFIDNYFHAYSIGSDIWNLSYPEGGNFWSGYEGTDIYSGPHQDQPGADGIGDSSYYFYSGHDYYPFMNPDGWNQN